MMLSPSESLAFLATPKENDLVNTNQKDQNAPVPSVYMTLQNGLQNIQFSPFGSIIKIR